MTTTRPYRRLLEFKVAYAELQKYSGTQFDNEFVEIFLQEHQKLLRDGIRKPEIQIQNVPRKKDRKKAA
jgi:HD-GYP domain-containing protein (c-di-GMP phosphodiesterase class II)